MHRQQLYTVAREERSIRLSAPFCSHRLSTLLDGRSGSKRREVIIQQCPQRYDNGTNDNIRFSVTFN